jgi:hypothetical protein
MKRIPFDNKKTVYDKLTPLQRGKKTCSKIIPQYENTFSKIPFNDYFKLLPIIMKYFFSCNERNKKYFSKINLRNYIKKNKFSKETENMMGKIVGPYLGFDYHHASLYDLLYCYEMMQNNSSTKTKFNITSLPTNYAWFDPWTKFLKLKGVEIKLNHEVKKISLQENDGESTISNIIVSDNLTKKLYSLHADYYINCTGPEILEKLLNPYKLYKNVKTLYNNINKVAKNGMQIQLSIYYYIDKKIFLERKNTLAYLPNTPWLLMVLPTGHIWGDEYMSKYCDSKIKEVISVGICEPYVRGNLIKKPWSKCTEEEIKIEAWNQLINDTDFKNNICIGNNGVLRKLPIHGENKDNINNIKIIDFKMWDSYIFKKGKIETYEPKWANNVNTIQYRPKSTTDIPNLFIAGSYSDTSTGTYSMESAAESGKIAAKKLCKKDNKKENIFLHIKKKYAIVEPIRWLDSIFYN